MSSQSIIMLQTQPINWQQRHFTLLRNAIYIEFRCT